ncbi:hypothetical protein K431DRAFT_283762 [Polychaeton citri CBS 116435]|uniref:Alpha,alpha-trehalase n=1 Tax=Polychaeton citri CBS 116435 TaxID=1314669 RepID=A0A9P4URI3_9PEZI|nr:hypothetical protein K431DRAFT_283762 [Polychaeton citri CBS 116435]
MLNYVALLLAACLAGSDAQVPPPPEDQNTTGTAILDHSFKIANLTGQDFLLNNIPFIDIPDPLIEAVYYYRFGVLQRHLYYTGQSSGYGITEFVKPVSYAGPLDTITAAAGHHIEEARWLRSRFFAEDALQIYTRGPGNGGILYTHWIHHAALGAANVTGNTAFLNSQLEGMVRMWHLWDGYYNDTIGLYFYDTDFDAQEYALPGFISWDASGRDNDTLVRDGPNTYRPSHNSYMAANAKAIASIATAIGDSMTASDFTNFAQNITAAIIESLWDDTQQFFVDNIEPGHPAPGRVKGREEVGYFPFRFGIGLESKYINPSIEALQDPHGFNTSFYPPTLETQNEFYTADKGYQDVNPGYCCWWQGQNWPFSTAHFLKSLAAMYRSGDSSLTAEQFHDAVANYAATQQKDGVPYVAESHYPDRDEWSQDDLGHSDHYMHSTNCDIIITELLGLVPRSDDILQVDPIVPSDWTYFALENVPYHGFLITVVYDRNGDRYNVGSGLTIYANGKKIHNDTALSATVQLPSTRSVQSNFDSASAPIDVNIAVNPLTLFPDRQASAWPRANASYTWQNDDPYRAIDGFIFYDEDPDNRWTNFDADGAHVNDTLTIQLQRPHEITGVALAIFTDIAPPRNGSVDCPASILITDGEGNVVADLQDFESTCKANNINVIEFDETVETDTLNFNFFAKPNMAIGVCEIQLWVPANTGPLYYAVDANPTSSAGVSFDASSKATSNGAVMVVGESSSVVSFGGIYSAAGVLTSASLRYKNSGNGSVMIRVAVNQIDTGSVELTPTGDKFRSVNLPDLKLWRGTNFVTISGGGEGVSLEGIEAS